MQSTGDIQAPVDTALHMEADKATKDASGKVEGVSVEACALLSALALVGKVDTCQARGMAFRAGKLFVKGSVTKIDLLGMLPKDFTSTKDASGKWNASKSKIAKLPKCLKGSEKASDAAQAFIASLPASGMSSASEKAIKASVIASLRAFAVGSVASENNVYATWYNAGRNASVTKFSDAAQVTEYDNTVKLATKGEKSALGVSALDVVRLALGLPSGACVVTEESADAVTELREAIHNASESADALKVGAALIAAYVKAQAPASSLSV